MKKTLLIALLVCIFSNVALNAEPFVKYVEAEDFRGNAYITPDNEASGGKILTGKTWFVFIQNLPMPKNAEASLYCFVRIRSAFKANWYLAYDSAKPFGWFSTPGNNKWVWVNLGKFKADDTNKGIMPRLCLQKPIGVAEQTTEGAVDAVVFTDSNDVMKVQDLFKKRQAPASLTKEPPKADTPAKNTKTIAHYVEAEDFNGNAYVTQDKDASGGKILTGKTWYVFLQNLPIPQETTDSLYCFVRMRSALKANWFLAYDTAKPFGWSTTPGDNKWVWVNIGRFKADDANKGLMPRLFLQKPIGSTAQTTEGAVDAVVFSNLNDIKTAEDLFRSRFSTTPTTTTNNAGMAKELANVHRFYSVKTAQNPPILDGELDDAIYKRFLQQRISCFSAEARWPRRRQP